MSRRWVPPGVMAALRSPAVWCLIAIFAAEFFLFDQFGARRHTGVFPRWNDQIQYLSESYSAYEFSRSRGVVAGLLNALTNPSAQGTLHDFFALVVFLVAGPSRSAALAVNMLALIAWQVALYAGVGRASGSRPLAIAAAMLPLALTGPWQNIPGSAYDFRLDHMAMCAIGISSAALLFVDDFRSRRAATWFGVAVGTAILTRFLVGTYFVLLFVGLAVWIAGGSERKLRLRNLLRAGLIATLIAGPFLWINYDTVREYYWIGHYVGPESVIRNPHLNAGRSLSFVGREVAQRHVGTIFAALAVVGGVVLASLRTSPIARPAMAAPWIIGALYVASPFLVLTLHPQKSEVVVGAIVPGLVVLTVAAWLTLSRRAGPLALWLFAGAVVTFTLTWFARHQRETAYSPETLADIRQVNATADTIFQRATAAGLREPRVAVDYITDSLDAQVLRVVVYERKHRWVPFKMTLPTGIAEPSAELINERLAQSDFVFVTEEAPVGPYPFDRKLAELRPHVRAWCEANLRAAEHFTLFGRRMMLYQRREIPFP